MLPRFLCLLPLALVVPAQSPQQVPNFPPELVAPNPYADIARTDPAHYKVEYATGDVRVLRLRLKADETVPMHEDPSGLLVALSECHLRFKRPDGKIQDVHLQAGETRRVWEDTRSYANLGTRPLELLYIETRGNAQRPQSP